mgnify:CR=1 FL=1|tara:strand:+ start:324 stop:1301 length:978 start_codon:yes stop_codon:yes gene_type:complete
MQKLLALEDFSRLSYICGTEDSNIKSLQSFLGITIDIKPNGLLLNGSKEKIAKASKIISKMDDLAKEGVSLSQEDLASYLNNYNKDKDSNSLAKAKSKDGEPGIRVSSLKKKLVFPKTPGQKKYIEAIQKNDIVFSTGPAGTGKTYLAMAMAINFLLQKSVRRIILTRPAMEAGESLGFLPGDIHEKLSPYLRPLYDALYDMMDADVIEDNLETGVIEIAPLAYMRGRTLNNAFVILDEAQNCTAEQLRMFLTRLGFDSKAVITGDTTQSDLPGGTPAGLIEAIDILSKIKGIKLNSLGKKDVIRHPLIQKIIHAYESHYSKKRN